MATLFNAEKYFYGSDPSTFRNENVLEKAFFPSYLSDLFSLEAVFTEFPSFSKQ